MKEFICWEGKISIDELIEKLKDMKKSKGDDLSVEIVGHVCDCCGDFNCFASNVTIEVTKSFKG